MLDITKNAVNKIVADNAPEVSMSTSFGDGPLPSTKLCRYSSKAAKRAHTGTEPKSIGEDMYSLFFRETNPKDHISVHIRMPRIANSVK